MTLENFHQMSPTEFVIFDFDGTLFNTDEAISHSIKLTFEVLLPASIPLESEVRKLIGSGRGLKDVLETLHPSPETFDQDQWTSTYRRIYSDEGQKLVSPFVGAKKLLESLHTRKVPVAVVSNKGVAAVETVLKNNGMGNIIPKDLIIGDNTPGAIRKPDPGSFTNVLAPAFKARGLSQDMDISKGLVIGDTEADLQFAHNIGAKSV
ncbi:phosphoglycolate phosphatase [Fusarium heterosporum]|uniref:Phosphoglycolate phosphatase n=1 Tax=Fusarium heterosporum TaxID=42747 RepID=A0A8H5STV5_FUSHE|nr:phosphoglycolate phosphatase [Fusarium heterosporum]